MRNSNGNLFEYGGNTLLELMNSSTTKDIKQWILQSVNAYSYMQARRISHFDIKPENMVYKNGILKVIDLGSTIEFTHKSSVYKPLGISTNNIHGVTYSYCPPEVQQQHEESNWIADKIDSYCWGMSFFQLLTIKTTRELEKFRHNIEPLTQMEYNNKFLDMIENSEELKGLDENNNIKKAIILSLNYDPHKRYDFQQIQKLLQPLENEAYLTDKQAIDSFMKIGKSYMEIIGNYEIALHYFTQALKLEQKNGDNLNIAEIYKYIASVYNKIGDQKASSNYKELIKENISNYKKALEYYNLSLNIMIKILGEDHPGTASSYYNIGITYYNMGDYKKALEYLLLSLKIRKRILGEEHPDIATSYNNIGLIYKNMGDNKKAIEYNEFALKINKKILGEENPDTATFYNNIGSIYETIGDFMKSLEYYELSLKITKKNIWRRSSKYCNIL